MLSAEWNTFLLAEFAPDLEHMTPHVSMDIVHVVLQTVQEPVTIIPPYNSDELFPKLENVKVPLTGVI